MNPFKELFNDLQPVVPYIGRWILVVVSEIGAATIYPIAAMVRGQFTGIAISLASHVLNILFRYPLQLVLTVAALVLNALASFINNVFLQSQERGLNDAELQYLQVIYGQNLDYSAIRIQTNGIKEKLKISPQAVAGDIFLRKCWGSSIVNDDATLSVEGLRLLGHEACHVWQYQQFGAGYIGDSLMTQTLALIGAKLGIHLSDGYDLNPALKAQRACSEFNVEQQAVMAELIGMACHAHESTQLNSATFNRVSGLSLNDEAFCVVQQAHQWLRGL